MRCAAVPGVSDEMCLDAAVVQQAASCWFAELGTSAGTGADPAQTERREAVADRADALPAGRTGAGRVLIRLAQPLRSARSCIADGHGHRAHPGPRGVRRAGVLLPRLPRAAGRQPAGPGHPRRAARGMLITTRLPTRSSSSSPSSSTPACWPAGSRKLPHYFTPFQAFVVRQAEEEKPRFPMADGAARARTRGRRTGPRSRPGRGCSSTSSRPSPATGSATRRARSRWPADPFYDADWRAYIERAAPGRRSSTSPTWSTCGRSST